jgi:hypothetical protein
MNTSRVTTFHRLGLNVLFRKGYDCVGYDCAGYEMCRNYKKNNCMKRVLYFTLEKLLFIAFINKS